MTKIIPIYKKVLDKLAQEGKVRYSNINSLHNQDYANNILSILNDFRRKENNSRIYINNLESKTTEI